MSQATLGQSPYRNSSLFSGYYLDERIDDLEEWECDQQAQNAFEELQQLWELEGGLVSGYKEDELLDSWIDEVLDILGFGTQSETTVPGSGGGYNDRLLFDSEETRRNAAKRAMDGNQEAMYGMASAVLEAKQWDANFSKKFDEQRSYRDASHQIKYYLEHTPERLQWGILTDGKKWRLYGTKDYATEIYYEVDLPELLEAGNIEDFKYFYAFFRPEAFREVAGTTFLDTVWNESETAAQELGEDLQDNVFTALRVLGEGFIHTNDLDIDPDDEAARAELKEQSLVLLYRLMFVLYAESRGLIHPEDPDAQTEYEENFSLDQIRLDIHDQITSGDSYDDWSGYATQIWGQLEDLFRLIDEGQESLGIPPYNGGLFDGEAHTFLAENEVADRYIAEVIHRLGTTEDEAGDPVPADYADLDTRHLGSIYEGLLEHEFRIASEPYAAVAEDGGQVWKPGTDVSVAEAVETVEEGELYVVNDDGERKATGAYYTPDYVVNYIVEETIDPLLDDIRDQLETDGLDPSDQAYFGQFYAEVQDLKILDPAMGSAHFLTSATAYLTEQVMEIVREQERQGRDEQEIRRTIAKECIYGVDVNGMAVELGKLSMWLETLAADKPLAFLDHHIKTGNSLVGSDITEVLSDDTQENGGQLTLTQALAHARQRTLEHVMDLMEELLAIDNNNLTDIKSMEEIYDKIREDPLYTRLFELANVHTAEEFGCDVPEDAYEEMAGAIEDEDDWTKIRGEDWFTAAQATAEEQDFFHWELEFPEVFFDAEGEKMGEAGFDAIVGNPPYVRIHRIGHSQADYIQNKFETTSQKTDLSLPFLELGVRLDSRQGSAAFISTSQWVSTDYGETAREFFSDGTVSKMVDFGTLPVFKNVSTYPAIFVLNSSNTDTLQYLEVGSKSELNHEGLANTTARPLAYDRFSEEAWVFDGLDLRTTLNSTDGTDPISDYGGFKIGALTGEDDVFVVDQETIDANSIESEILLPYAHRGEEVRRFGTVEPEARVIYPYNEGVDGESELIEQELLQSQYPNAHSYLKSHQDSLSERQDSRRYYAEGEDWYCFLRPGRFDYANPEKLIMKGVATEATVGYLGPETLFSGANCPGFIPDEEKHTGYFISLLNSKLISQYLIQVCPAKMQGYTRFNANNLNEVPVIIPRSIDWEEVRTEVESVVSDTDTPLDRLDDTEYKQREVYPVFLDILAGRQREQVDKRNLLETDLRVHLGEYRPTEKLTNIGLIQPQKSSKLDYTKEDYKNLRVGTARVARESRNTVLIEATARYKPDDKDAHETDQWGYTETECLPAFRITDLTEREADLIEHFVPVAVDEAGGFANFRETATKTNSLIDRLKAIEVPDVDDVADDLENYLETKERAEELDENISKTDTLIDEIVYELYGLTDEEIEIVEEATTE